MEQPKRVKAWPCGGGGQLSEPDHVLLLIIYTES